MRIGTDIIMGQNTALDAAQIGDHELQSSTGTSPTAGVWGPEPEDTLVHSPVGTMQGMSVAGDPSSPSDTPEVSYFDDVSLYVDGVDTGFDMDSDPENDHYEMLPIEGGHLIWGATDDGADEDKPMVHRNGHLRQLGPWVPQIEVEPTTLGHRSHIYAAPAVTKTTITAITQAANAQVTSTANGIVATDPLYIEASDATEANGRTYTAVSWIDVNNFTIDVSSTGWNDVGTTGDLYEFGCGLSGDYRFYFTCLVKCDDGTVIESRPRGLRGSTAALESFDAETFTLTVGSQVAIWISEYYDAAGYNVHTISGTEGVDFWRGFRLYRTKAGGSDLYMMDEWYYGDSGFGSGSDATGDYHHVVLLLDEYPMKTDKMLTNAFFDTNITDRNVVPKAYDAEICGQRLGLIDKDNRHRFYYSALDGIDYFDSLGYIHMPEKLHMVGEAGGKWVISGARRVWTVDMSSGLPYVEEVDTSVGHVYPSAKTLTERGTEVVRDDGVWVFDGAVFGKVSRSAYTEVDGTPSTICKTDDILLACSKDADGEYPGIKQVYTDAGPVWHSVSAANGGAVVRGAFDGTVYRMTPDGIWSLYTADTFKVGAATSKLFPVPGGRTWTPIRLVFMCEGPGDIEATVTSNSTGPVPVSEFQPDGSVGTGQHGRTKVWGFVPRIAGEFFTVSWEVHGDVNIYGCWLDDEAG